MRFPWSHAPESEELIRLRRENAEMDRAITETQPLVDEATRRTNDSFIAVEKRTRELQDDLLLRDLEEGWGLHSG